MHTGETDAAAMYDVVIVGTGEHQPSKTSRRQRLTDYGDSAGLYGIQAARYYLDVHPDAKLLLLEADDVVGGTWSSSRCFSFFPMYRRNLTCYTRTLQFSKFIYYFLFTPLEAG